MKRRIVGLSLFLVCALLSGCESLHHGLRHKSDEPPLWTSDEPKDHDEVSTARRGVFKSSRLPGAMSDEGAEIEKSLGIH